MVVYDRVATVVIPRAEAEAIRQREIAVRCAPSARDAREYRAESVSVDVPRLLPQPAPTAP